MASIDLGSFSLDHVDGAVRLVRDGGVVETLTVGDAAARKHHRVLTFGSVGLNVSLSASEWDTLLSVQSEAEAVSEERAEEVADAPAVVRRRGRR